MQNYTQNLVRIGLSENEALVYEILLSMSRAGVAVLLRKAPTIKRGNMYNIIYSLIEKGLVTEAEEEGKKVFLAESPSRLLDLAEKQEAEYREGKAAIELTIPTLLSTFNLGRGKPNVRYFEGLDGMKKVIEDSVNDNPQKNLRTYTDVAGYMRYLRDWNVKVYAPRRLREKVFERAIIPNHPDALKYMEGYTANAVTEILFIPHEQFKFVGEVNIYNNKVSFVTFSDVSHIGVLIESKEIYETLAASFDLAWKYAKPALAPEQPTWAKELRTDKRNT